MNFGEKVYLTGIVLFLPLLFYLKFTFNPYLASEFWSYKCLSEMLTFNVYYWKKVRIEKDRYESIDDVWTNMIFLTVCVMIINSVDSHANWAKGCRERVLVSHGLQGCALQKWTFSFRNDHATAGNNIQYSTYLPAATGTQWITNCLQIAHFLLSFLQPLNN